MTLRKSVVPAAFALAGCFQHESERPADLEQVTYETPIEGGECQVEPVTYQVRAELVRDDGDKSAAAQGSLLVTVAEGSSVVDCDADIMRVAVPGAELTTTSFDVESEAFELDVPAVVIGGHRPSIWVQALLDVNDNGHCDEGEPVGVAELEAGELGELAIELSRNGCPHRN